MDTTGQVRTLKESALPTILATVWTFLDRIRPDFHRQGGKTGGPPSSCRSKFSAYDFRLRTISRTAAGAIGVLEKRTGYLAGSLYQERPKVRRSWVAQEF